MTQIFAWIAANVGMISMAVLSIVGALIAIDKALLPIFPQSKVLLTIQDDLQKVQDVVSKIVPKQ